MSQKLTTLILGGAILTMARGCASRSTDLDRGYAFGQAIKSTIAAQSIRDVDVPNSKGLAGTSAGDRAVAAVERLSNGEVEQPSLPTQGRGQ